jgi:hypothetical protein
VAIVFASLRGGASHRRGNPKNLFFHFRSSNYMIEQVFKKPNKKGCPKYMGAEKYLYFSAPFLDIYFPKKKNVIKNYIQLPDTENIR